MRKHLDVFPVTGLPEVAAGDDLAALIAEGTDLRDGDVVSVTSKIVSKAEGRLTHGTRQEAIDAELVRVVAQRGETRIVQTRHGLVMAAAGHRYVQHRPRHGPAAPGRPRRVGPAAADRPEGAVRRQRRHRDHGHARAARGATVRPTWPSVPPESAWSRTCAVRRTAMATSSR